MDKPRILFVDDEPHVTAALTRSLRREPWDVLSAVSAKDALVLLERRGVDVIVSDEQMPGMTGSELLALVREKYPKTIRMILTGQASLEAAIRAINQGEVYRFFTKPCNEVDLKITIRQALLQRGLAEQSRQLLAQYRKQSSMLQNLERENPGITSLETDASGAYVIEPVEGDIEALLDQLAGVCR